MGYSLGGFFMKINENRNNDAGFQGKQSMFVMNKLTRLRGPIHALPKYRVWAARQTVGCIPG